MPKCKITVVKRMVNPDLVDEYMEEGQKSYEPCDRFEDGQELVVDEWSQVPDGFCAHAWADIHKEVALLLNGGSYQPWVKEGTKIACCTYGLRPVVFKMQRIE
jgi:uncharacterized repeat protein (TIGR04076 family)